MKPKGKGDLSLNGQKKGTSRMQGFLITPREKHGKAGKVEVTVSVTYAAESLCCPRLLFEYNYIS